MVYSSFHVPMMRTLILQPKHNLNSLHLPSLFSALQVRIIPFKANVTYSMSLAEILPIPRDEASSVTYYGNADVTGPDHINNAEQVRLYVRVPAALEISVYARRIVRGTGTLASTQTTPCQSFALVWTGPLLGGMSNIMPFTTNPSPLAGGICGRNPNPPQPSGFSGGWLVATILCSIFGVTLTATLFFFWRRSRALVKYQENYDNDGKSKSGRKIEALPTPQPDRRGVARKGGRGWLILGGGASRTDGIYSGRLIVVNDDNDVTSPEQVAVITDYDGETQRAELSRELDLRSALDYTLTSAEAHRPARGYVTGDLGIVPYAEMPATRRQDPSGGIYPKLLIANRTAQDHTRRGREDNDFEDPPTVVRTQQIFDEGLEHERTIIPDADKRKAYNTHMYLASVRSRKQDAKSANVSVITHGIADPYTVQGRGRQVFRHDLPLSAPPLYDDDADMDGPQHLGSMRRSADDDAILDSTDLKDFLEVEV
mmetsp:Transcript_89153/g.237978  ORF Transcript_89153/g.237978 Transcript_89153/m.237978 type:complete len:485 (+) Transcript_89153:6002-7456(+)